MRNADGDSPKTFSPDMAVDGDDSTDWLNFDSGPLQLEFEEPVEVHSFSFCTSAVGALAPTVSACSNLGTPRL